MLTQRRSLTGVSVVLVIGFATIGVLAFDPQPDPPAFGVISVTPAHTLRLNVVCSAHGIGTTPPTACAAELMFHNAAGEIIGKQDVALKPAEATYLDVSVPEGRDPAERVGIIPCVIPNPNSGRLLPTAEVFDTASGQTTLFVNPVTPKLSLLKIFRLK